MNIAILTLPLHQNYGGILQSLALQEFLIQQGHNVTLLDRRKNRSDENIGSRIYNYISQNILHYNIQLFIKNNIHRTSPIRSQHLLEEIAKNFDAIIVGSDQVWRLSMVKGLETNYFLDFAPKSCRKIVYSASFGTTTWEGNETITSKIIPLVHLIDSISVRELDGLDLCQQILGVTAVHTIDPVFLHRKEFYFSYFSTNTKDHNDETLFYYFLNSDNEKHRATEILSSRICLTPVSVNPFWNVDIGKFSFSSIPGVEKWGSSIRSARFILTDSFHVVAFSIIFNKPFIVIPNKLGGLSRIHSILSQFGLESRLKTAEDLNKLTINELMTIDYSDVNRRMEQARTFSVEYLINSLCC